MKIIINNDNYTANKYAALLLLLSLLLKACLSLYSFLYMRLFTNGIQGTIYTITRNKADVLQNHVAIRAHLNVAPILTLFNVRID